MKDLPVFIAVLVGVTLIRLALRRRGRGSPPRTGIAVPRLRGQGLLGRGLLGDMGLVARREIRERVRARLFWVVTVILLAVVAAAVLIPALHTGHTVRQRVGVVASSAPLEAELHDLAKSAGLPVQLVSEPGLPQARAAVTAGRLDLVVDGTRLILVQEPVLASDTTPAARYVRALSIAFGAQHAFAQARLTPQQAATVARARPVPVESIQPGKKPRTTAETTALFGVILIFIVLTQYLSWTLMGVMEEKASRVVEVLLATVRPVQLLAGKVIGIGAVALAQALALVAVALALAEVVGSSLVHGAAPLVVAATIIWLVLGYAFYSWVYAAAGSLAERQDQVQSMALPLSAPLIFGYVVALIGASSGSPSLLLKVLAYLPPTAPFAMPTLVGFGAATWWQFLLSVTATLACTVIVALLAAQIYRNAILQIGSRVRLRDLLPALAK